MYVLIRAKVSKGAIAEGSDQSHHAEKASTNHIHILQHARIQKCFDRVGPTLTTFFLMGERIQIPLRRAIIGPPEECWLSSFVAIQGIRFSIAKKPYIFVIFQWGWSGHTVPPSGSAHVQDLSNANTTCTSQE